MKESPDGYNLTLTNDFIFRSIFGVEKNADILLSLVNAVLESKGLQPVIGIHPVNPLLAAAYMPQKEGILDVRAVDSFGVQYDLEIQVRSQENYIKRSLFYLSRMYGGQLNRGSEYELLTPCIGISILDFNLFKEGPFFHHLYTFREADHPDLELSRDMMIHFLELPKFIKLLGSVPVPGPDAADTLKLLEKWLYLLKEIDNPEDAMVQKILSTTPELDKVHDEYVEFMTNEALRAEALSHEMWLHDQASHKAEARQSRRESGRTPGTCKENAGKRF